MLPSLMKLGNAYNYHVTLRQLLHELISAPLPKLRPEAFIFAKTELEKGWTVMDRLGAIATPTLLVAGRFDFLFPPEHQQALAAGLPNARLEIIEKAAHNPHMEQPAAVMALIRGFLSTRHPDEARPVDARDVPVPERMTIRCELIEGEPIFRTP
jgi:proline iminopeptidase